MIKERIDQEETITPWMTAGKTLQKRLLLDINQVYIFISTMMHDGQQPQLPVGTYNHEVASSEQNYRTIS
jgi:hypothetical protein